MEIIMAHTLAAVFAQRDMAEHARQDLITAGFPSANIRLHDAGRDGAADTDDARRDEGDSLLDSVKHFFTDLFGSHADRHIYAEAVRRGHIVLTLEEASDADIQRATDLVERYAPIDIDAHAEHWRSSGWPGAAASAPGDSGQRQGASMQSQQGTSAGNMNPPGASSQQFAGSMPQEGGRGSATVRHYPGADNLPRTSDDDEQDYQVHWRSQYAASGARFEDYDPAYRYGHSMAGSDSYRGQSWEQVEAELRSNWEHTYPQSAWEDFKAAVRHGWERVTS
ncbi:MAG: hypothetical protein EBS11_07850 [Janthinobacterium sp.]|nr:hypothetical protein [Janthinobacterium sp.]